MFAAGVVAAAAAAAAADLFSILLNRFIIDLTPVVGGLLVNFCCCCCAADFAAANLAIAAALTGSDSAEDAVFGDLTIGLVAAVVVMVVVVSATTTPDVCSVIGFFLSALIDVGIVFLATDGLGGLVVVDLTGAIVVVAVVMEVVVTNLDVVDDLTSGGELVVFCADGLVVFVGGLVVTFGFFISIFACRSELEARLR